MLTNYNGVSSVGYYIFAEKIATILKLIMDSVNKSWGPYFQNKATENTQKGKIEIGERYIEISFFIAVIGFTLICFSEELVKILTVESYYSAMYLIPLYVGFYLFGILGMM